MYSLATTKPPSPELKPIIVGTLDTCLKSAIGWLHRNASSFESHDSVTGGKITLG